MLTISRCKVNRFPYYRLQHLLKSDISRSKRLRAVFPERLTGKTVTFESDMLISTVTYPLALTKDSRNAGENGENGENKGENGENNDENEVLEIIRKTPSITQPLIAIETGFSTRKVNRIIASLRKKEIIKRIGKTKGGHWETLSN